MAHVCCSPCGSPPFDQSKRLGATSSHHHGHLCGCAGAAPGSLTSLAPKLAAMGIRDMDQLNGMTPEQIMGVATTYPELERLCHLLGRPIPKRPAPRTPYQRQDVPVVGAASRGSITGAMAAAHPEAREAALRNLHRDQYANNTRNTRDSRWNLWTRLANNGASLLYPSPLTL